MRFSSLTLVALAALAASPATALTPSSNTPRVAKTAFAPKAIAIPLDQQQQLQETTEQLKDHDEWVANLDYEGFGKEVTALGKMLIARGGQEDVDHLDKMVAWRNAAALIGVATMWLAPNPLTIVALSTWTYVSWTMIAHHTCHGGYNRMDASGFNSRGFALGSVVQRCKDWLDWMQPEAWNVEHNRLHHYRLNEVSDPDLVQRNLEWVREDEDMPMWLRYGIVGFFMPVWKWFYYAPNTFKELKTNQWVREGKDLPKDFVPTDAITVMSLLKPSSSSGEGLTQVVDPVEFATKVLGPFFLTRFVLLPAPLLAIPGVGPTLFAHAIVNLIAAELLTNIHAFGTIVTNHAGEDLYTFDDAVKPKTPSFYVRQIVGSANYATGTDLIDFSHGWLNYQIEHHVWPDLSMKQYQEAAPQLKALCEKYGVPYVQESVFERLRKTVDIMVGKTSMRPFPTQYEPQKDKATNGVTWKSTNGAIDEE